MEGQAGELGQLEQIVVLLGEVVEVAGVLVLVFGLILATIFFFLHTQRGQAADATYASYRQGIGRALLLGLEILVAGDIIRTVAVDPTFTSIGVLPGIVLIRTFLSFSLEVEIEGHWPWRRRELERGSRGEGS